jgi:hypothetical protein
MSPTVDIPKQTLVNLNRALAKVLEQHAILDKLEAAGDDVSLARAQVNQYQEKLNAYKREFFPTER